MKKLPYLLLAVILITPNLVSAAWWNPISWFNNWSFTSNSAVENKLESNFMPSANIQNTPKSTASSSSSPVLNYEQLVKIKKESAAPILAALSATQTTSITPKQNSVSVLKTTSTEDYRIQVLGMMTQTQQQFLNLKKILVIIGSGFDERINYIIQNKKVAEDLGAKINNTADANSISKLKALVEIYRIKSDSNSLLILEKNLIAKEISSVDDMISHQENFIVGLPISIGKSDFDKYVQADIIANKIANNVFVNAKKIYEDFKTESKQDDMVFENGWELIRQGITVNTSQYYNTNSSLQNQNIQIPVIDDCAYVLDMLTNKDYIDLTYEKCRQPKSVTTIIDKCHYILEKSISVPQMNAAYYKCRLENYK